MCSPKSQPYAVPYVNLTLLYTAQVAACGGLLGTVHTLDLSFGTCDLKPVVFGEFC
jgi:hypothetical protein